MSNNGTETDQNINNEDHMEAINPSLGAPCAASMNISFKKKNSDI